MCIVILCEKEFPTYDTLLSAEQMNPNGAGIAYIENNKVKWVKGITAKRIFEITQSGINLPAIIHFRIATVGGIKTNLTHPFPITSNVSIKTEGEADRVLFHNGHWAEWQENCMKAVINTGIHLPNGKWSDSRAIAWLVHLYGKSFLNLIPDDNKIAILSKKGIEKFGNDWKKVKNVECSNDYFDNPFKTGNFPSQQSIFNGFDDMELKDFKGMSDYEMEKELRSYGYTDEEIETSIVERNKFGSSLDYDNDVYPIDNKPYMSDIEFENWINNVKPPYSKNQKKKLRKIHYKHIKPKDNTPALNMCNYKSKTNSGFNKDGWKLNDFENVYENMQSERMYER